MSKESVIKEKRQQTVKIAVTLYKGMEVSVKSDRVTDCHLTCTYNDTTIIDTVSDATGLIKTQLLEAAPYGSIVVCTITGSSFEDWWFVQVFSDNYTQLIEVKGNPN